MKTLPILATAALFLAACHVHVRDEGRVPTAHRDDPVVIQERRQPPPPVVVQERQEPVVVPVSHPPPLQGTFRAKEIRADVVRARVIYCKEIHARSGGIAAIYKGKHGGHGDWGGQEVRMPEVVADVIYAKEIHAGHVEAQEAHCKEVKIHR